jgi:hypothetical protein
MAKGNSWGGIVPVYFPTSPGKNFLFYCDDSWPSTVKLINGIATRPLLVRASEDDIEIGFADTWTKALSAHRVKSRAAFCQECRKWDWYNAPRDSKPESDWKL